MGLEICMQRRVWTIAPMCSVCIDGRKCWIPISSRDTGPLRFSCMHSHHSSFLVPILCLFILKCVFCWTEESCTETRKRDRDRERQSEQTSHEDLSSTKSEEAAHSIYVYLAGRWAHQGAGGSVRDETMGGHSSLHPWSHWQAVPWKVGLLLRRLRDSRLQFWREAVIFPVGWVKEISDAGLRRNRRYCCVYTGGIIIWIPASTEIHGHLRRMQRWCKLIGTSATNGLTSPSFSLAG